MTVTRSGLLLSLMFPSSFNLSLRHEPAWCLWNSANSCHLMTLSSFRGRVTHDRRFRMRLIVEVDEQKFRQFIGQDRSLAEEAEALVSDGKLQLHSREHWLPLLSAEVV